MDGNQKYFENSTLLYVATLFLAVIYFKLRSQCKRLHKEMQGKSQILEYIKNETIQNKQIQNTSIYTLLQAEINFLDERRLCIKHALDSIPENTEPYNELKEDLMEVETNLSDRLSFKEDIDSGYLKISSSNRCKQTKIIFDLRKKQPLHHCPLESFIEKTPIEDIFWKACSPDQRNKLDEELNKLKDIYPRKPVISAWEGV
ncbi:uncharacterized protein LOC124161049 isoform X2 [Ischnura elegans]|uniref:uncharacterized protein LOC124161049 isoform X2 n=1 Tax=Ischnura elegans TaxID=197161 RepID=UPI001ED8A5C0|nr:uncharacterized protein LOC124161049 isoform X2 [Ischnura elegans]